MFFQLDFFLHVATDHILVGRSSLHFKYNLDNQFVEIHVSIKKIKTRLYANCIAVCETEDESDFKSLNHEKIVHFLLYQTPADAATGEQHTNSFGKFSTRIKNDGYQNFVGNSYVERVLARSFARFRSRAHTRCQLLNA